MSVHIVKNVYVISATSGPKSIHILSKKLQIGTINIFCCIGSKLAWCSNISKNLGTCTGRCAFNSAIPILNISESHIIVKEISCHSRYQTTFFIYFLMLLYNLLCMSAINAMWELRFSMLLIYIVKIFFSKQHPINLLCPSVCRS